MLILLALPCAEDRLLEVPDGTPAWRITRIPHRPRVYTSGQVFSLSPLRYAEDIYRPSGAQRRVLDHWVAIWTLDGMPIPRDCMERHAPEAS